MACNRNRSAAQVPQAADNCPLIGIPAVPMNFEEIAHQPLDVVKRLRTRALPSQPHPLDRGWRLTQLVFRYARTLQSVPPILFLGSPQWSPVSRILRRAPRFE